jgi:formylglycine-generating enzyme required for sulfatase activity
MHSQIAAQYPDTQMVHAALAAWDRATKEQRRRIVGVGGSDCHGHIPYAVVPMRVTSVAVASADEDGLRRGLVAAHATFGRGGGASARDFAAAIAPFARPEEWTRPRAPKKRVLVVAGLTALPLVALGLWRARIADAPAPAALQKGPSPAKAPTASPERATGWSGERLPDGLRRGPAPPVLIWDTQRGLELELVYVPPGKFIMGSDDPHHGHEIGVEQPKHAHPLPHGYWIGRHDVTWKQLLLHCRATGMNPPPRPDWAGEDHPAVNVTFEEARSFCDWAGLGLPSEAEWEKAARGTDGRRFPWGDEWDGSLCNHGDTADGGPDTSDGFAFTSPVGAFPRGASPCGALDMVGDVWQWCEDWYEETAYARYARGDVVPPRSGQSHVTRGGSWANACNECRASTRGYDLARTRLEILGFRVVLRES